MRDMLADDFWLGEFTRMQGLRTVLSDVVVATDVIDASLTALWHHEVRWLRTIRGVASRLSFALLFITFTFPVLMVGLILAPFLWALGIAATGRWQDFCSIIGANRTMKGKLFGRR